MLKFLVVVVLAAGLGLSVVLPVLDGINALSAAVAGASPKR